MIGLIMCGGKGTRMKSSEEKLLLKYKKPVILHVLNALEHSGVFSKIICATSHNAPRTHEFISQLKVDVLETQGKGFVEDLHDTLESFDELVFVVSGDMPLLDSEIIKKIVDLADEKSSWTSILVRKNFLLSLGFETEFQVVCNGEECVYTGISIVNPKMMGGMQYITESNVILDDKRVATNLNTKKDYELLCAT